MKTWESGLVIGKFYPPHRGHRFLIETALSRVASLTIICCWRPGEVPAGSLRADWLREMFPTVRVLPINDIYYGHDDDSELWAQLTRGWLRRVPDVVFSSEAYGARYAHFLGCDHVEVDLPRAHIHISGTAVRSNPRKQWEFLDAPTRQFYARRVVVLGAESTGTTTLSQELASRLGAGWVGEYGREYCEKFWTGPEYPWQSREFTLIAAEQLRRENEAARACGGLIVCDTDAFATRLWHHRYLGHFSRAVDEIAASQRPDLYLLTGDEIPFVPDSVRDGEAIRHQMHAHFVQELRAQELPWHLVSGSREERLQQALSLIQPLLET